LPQAGIEPTPRTDTGYRPVSQTRQTRREQLGHHKPRQLSQEQVDADNEFVPCGPTDQAVYHHETLASRGT
jgi:hypothetical protein